MEIKDMVAKYGNKAEEEIKSDLMLRKRGKKYYCVWHDEGKVPNLSYDKERNIFKCFSCGKTYNIYDHLIEYHNLDTKEAYKKLKEMLGGGYLESKTKNKSKKEKNITQPNSNYKEPKLKDTSNKVYEYMELRGISKKTLNDLGVKEKDGLIAITYYNEYGNQVGIKYRKPKKYNGKGPKYWFEDNSKSILYNYNNIHDKESIILTEGEIDAMAIYECGFDNVSSIPTGANSNDEWIQNHWEYLQQLDEIILCLDNDKNGYQAREEIERRLNDKSKNKVKYVELNEKDANLELFKNGKESLKEIINNPLYFGKDDYVETSSIDRNLKPQKRLVTGFKGVDYAINGLREGRTTLITSRTNEGKTTFVSEIIINNIEEKNKIFAYVGEDTKSEFKESLYLKVAGHLPKTTFTKTLNIRKELFVKDSVYEALDRWSENKLFLHHADDYHNWHHDKVFKAMERAVKKDGVRLIIIDNLMKVLVTNATEIYQDQAKFVEKVTKFDKKHGTHTIIVSHARKGKGRNHSMELDDVMGSSDISNKVDNVIAVYRVTGDEFDGEECNYDGVVEILKGRKFGEIPRMYTVYDEKTRSINEVYQPNTENEEILRRKIKWEDYLSDDIDRKTYKKIKPNEDLMSSSPF
jgi:twinkle protein